MASLLVGLVVAAPVALLTTWEVYPIVAWDVAGAVFVTGLWLRIWSLDEQETAALAVYEDPTRATADGLVLGAAVASLGAVALVLVRAAHSHGTDQDLLAGLGVASVVISWLVVHTTFTLRYARLYYGQADGGIDFHDERKPAFSDFAYLAFTVGMTFQVSDTEINHRDIRRTVLQQGLLSFLFVTGIVATTINLVAGLSGGGGGGGG